MPPENSSPINKHKNIQAYYIVAAVAAAAVIIWFLYSGYFLVKKPVEIQKTAEEKIREELIQSLVSPPSISPTAKEAMQISESVSSPKKQTAKTPERTNLIKSLTE